MKPIRIVLAVAALLLATSAEAQVQFVSAGPASGIQSYTTAHGKGGGVAAADFDDDGDVDLFVPNGVGVPDQLYRNLGDGTFEEIAADAGLASLSRNRVALWFDYDGDRLLDLMVAGDCWQVDISCPQVSTLTLYRQVADAQFQDVTIQAGIGDDLVETTMPHRGGMAAGDINNDGYLDLVLSLWQGEARLFLNDTDGTFTDISVTSGIGGRSEGHWQPMMHDFNGDGWLDIYHAIDFTGNRLWINQQDNTFIDVAPAVGLNNAWNDMGMALGDYDNDGDFDVYVTNITNGGRHNALFRNDSTVAGLQFHEISVAAGVSSGGWGWGTTFVDADNDGWLDVAATNGWWGVTDPSRFYKNNGAGAVFSDISSPIGFNDTLWGSTVVAFDFDRDGDLDLAQTCNSSGASPGELRLLENQPSGVALANNALTVRPRMAGPNHRAIGAVVRARVGSLELSRLITAGTSYYGQEPAEAFFGVGSATTIERLTVEWPDGSVTVREDVPTGQVLTIEQLVFTDITDVAGIQVPNTLTESVTWGDYDNDGDQDLYLTSNAANNLFRNDGGGVFTDVTEEAGVGDLGFSVGTAFADLDNDGDLDLYVVSFGTGPDVLYRNDGPSGSRGLYTFTNVTMAAGVTDQSSSRGVAFIDYDRDGLLDIYVNAIGPDILYHNLGGLVFQNVAGTLGVATVGQGVGVVATDLDDNGWVDLFTGNRSNDPNRLYMNYDGAFTDITAAAPIDQVGLGMGVLSLDYDNDLDFDLYWTSWPDVSNALYENLGDGSFSNKASESGTLDTDGWGISCNAADIDNDGYEDFLVTNGFSDTTSANALFHNNRDKTFSDVTSLIGGGDFDGRGVSFADFDGDGDMDVVVTGDLDVPTRLWRNDTDNGNHWLTLKLVGTCSNYSAVGSRIEVTTELGRFVKEVSGGAGRGSQNSLPVEFGLGTADAISNVKIRWTSGYRQTLTGLAPDTTHTIAEPPLCGAPALGLDADSMAWSVSGLAPGNTAFDVVRGDLMALRAGGGDFAASIEECLGNNLAVSSVDYAPDPGQGEGMYFLVRRLSPKGNGSYDSPSDTQAAPRDDGINASAASCP